MSRYDDDYYDEDEYYDDYEDYDQDDYYDDGRRAIDRGTNLSLIIILVLTALYVISPVDLIPGIIPVAGQADDLAAVVAGGGAASFVAALRFVLRTRVGRWGCAVVLVLSMIGACTVFWALLQLVESIS
ncbi:MAG: DUF1232 domain-containing protein [Chloroflexi bacterium]|nr:DUF1232 domain-containing protein [Chloroflexota bacterium]